MNTGLQATGPTTILLGAGASADAGIPTASELLGSVRELRSNPQLEHVNRAIDTALWGLHFANPWDIVDIEALYQTLLGLSDRRSHFLSPFVGAWHESVLMAERVGKTKDAADAMVRALMSDVRGALRSPAGIDTLDFKAFRDAARHALDVASGHSPTFHAAANEVLRIVIRSCWIPDNQAHRVDYLAPLIQAAATKPVWIATLNYDNTIELAARNCGVAVDRGIESGSTLGVRFQSQAPLTLAKLHGSLDWAPTDGGDIQILESRYMGKLPSAMIFGAGNKLRISGPYLDMLFAFRSQLERSHELHVCGYSFRDMHINYLIHSWLERDFGRRIIVADKCKTVDEIANNFLSSVSDAVGEMTAPLGSQGRFRVVGALQGRIVLRQVSAAEWAKTFDCVATGDSGS